MVSISFIVFQIANDILAFKTSFAAPVYSLKTRLRCLKALITIFEVDHRRHIMASSPYLLIM